MAIDRTYMHGRKYETTYRSFLLDDSQKTIPNMAVSPVTHLIQGFNFVVTLNNFTYGFTEVSGLDIKKRVEYLQEGGVNDHQIVVSAPSEDRFELQLKRGMMIRCNPVVNNMARVGAASIPNNLGRQAALMAVNSMDPQATLEQGPALGMIQVYDRNRRLSAMYTFLSLGMISWEVDSLDANRYDILIESITLAHTGLTRVPLGAPNTILGYIIPEKAAESKPDEPEEPADDIEKLEKELEDTEKEMKEKERELEKLKEEKTEKEEKLKKLKEEYEKLEKP